MRKANFLNNTAIRGTGIHNTFGTTTLTGEIRWEPTTEANTTVFSGNGITPAPATITNAPQRVQLDCAVPPIPTPQTAPPLNVPTEAQGFHSRALTYGLPVPFTGLPYNENQTGQSPNDPLGIRSANNRYANQGFGPTSFSSQNQNTYSQTYRIHSGIDYGRDGVWIDRVVVSICDGVIISGNWWQNGQPTGGSAQPGRGVSIRCFMDALDSGRADIDGDGKPNLSNIVVTYNHLQWNPGNRVDPVPPPHYIECALVDITPCNGQYELPRVGDVVRSGEVLGQTGARDGNPDTYDFDHLHLSVFLARGFARSSTSDNAFYLNPVLMFRADIFDLHYFQTYFPYRIGTRNLVGETKGIAGGELHYWSAGGFNSAPNGGNEANSFWNVQTPIPAPPNQVEWPYDNYPLIPSNNPIRIEELVEYLDQSFTNFPYQSVNCIVSFDVLRTPGRERATCDLSDLNNENPYTPVPHPTPVP